MQPLVLEIGLQSWNGGRCALATWRRTVTVAVASLAGLYPMGMKGFEDRRVAEAEEVKMRCV